MKVLSTRPSVLSPIFALVAFWASTSPARAQSELDPDPAIEIEANVGLTSDYRFRGVSLSDRKPALQGGVDVSIREGVFAGVWGSSIAKYGGVNYEFDVLAGFANTVAGIDMSAGGYAYIYPGGTGVNCLELLTSLGKSFGKVKVSAEFAYTLNQENTATDNVLAGVTVSRQIGNSPVHLKLRGGYEDGFYDSKWDWEAGLLLEHGATTASFRVICSNQGATNRVGRLAGTGVMAGLTFDF
jgi:uncharacterized protein (TIGR02001 family)